ncbi:hypothetical protein FO519_002315, partial [Halicephalobus sp. NKZ332]
MRIFYIILISILTPRLSAQGCTSCPPISIVCDPDAASMGVADGVVQIIPGTTILGCDTATVDCADDDGVPGYLFTPDGMYFDSGTIFNCSILGQWAVGVTGTFYCD